MPVESVAIRTWYFDETLDLKKFRTANRHYQVISQDPLIIELHAGHFAILTGFGCVTFWNYEPESARKLRDEIFLIVSDRSFFDEGLEERISVFVGAERDEVLPNAIHLMQADLPRMRIVARAIAQSVALDRLEIQLESALNLLIQKIQMLRDTGRVRLRAREMMKTVGFAMSVKHAILANLTLFDKPEIIWEAPELEKLYYALHQDTFDLVDRVRAMDRKLEFLEECVTLLLDFIQSRRLMGLEVAIVILILVEIILMFAFKSA